MGVELRPSTARTGPGRAMHGLSLTLRSMSREERHLTGRAWPEFLDESRSVEYLHAMLSTSRVSRRVDFGRDPGESFPLAPRATNASDSPLRRGADDDSDASVSSAIHLLPDRSTASHTLTVELRNVICTGH